MELFSITCTTCQARLKVRDLAAIGEILSCPKCQSMVLVEPPPGWQPPPHEKSTSQPAAQRSGPASTSAGEAGDLAETAPVDNPYGAAAAMSDTAAVETPPSRARAAVNKAQPPERSPSSPPGRRDAATSRPAGERSSTGGDSAGEPILPTADWTSPELRRRQRWLLRGGVAAVGLAVAAGLAGFVIYQVSRPRPAATAQADESNLGATEVESIGRDVPTTEPVSEPSGGETRAPTDPQPMDETPPVGQHDPAAADPVAGDESPRPPEIDAAPPDGAPPDTTPPDAAPPDLVPPDLVPRDDEIAGTAEAGGSAALLAELKGFSELFPEASFGPGVPPAGGTGEDASSTIELPAETERLPRPDRRNVDVTARLADPIAAMQFSGTPLIDFLRFVSDLSTIPITLDPAALQQAKASAASPVELRMDETTVGEMLQAALAPYHLVPVTVDQQLRIVHAEPKNGTLRETGYPVGDLIADKVQLGALGDWLVKLVAPASWAAGGGDGTVEPVDTSLIVRQSGPVHFEISIFLDKLRVARGLAPRGEFAPASSRLEPRAARAADKLATATSLNFAQTTRFVQILDRLSEQADVRILVDWQAAAEIGWNPDAETTLSVDKLPLGQSLVELLEPMELTYRVIDEHTLEVTTPAARDASLEVEFYPCGDLLSDELDLRRLVQRVKTSLGDAPLADRAGEIEFDTASGCLIASLAQHDQIALAQLLAHWRASESSE